MYYIYWIHMICKQNLFGLINLSIGDKGVLVHLSNHIHKSKLIRQHIFFYFSFFFIYFNLFYIYFIFFCFFFVFLFFSYQLLVLSFTSNPTLKLITFKDCSLPILFLRIVFFSNFVKTSFF